MAAFLWLSQDSMIFLRQPSRGLAVAPPGWTLENVSLAAADGTPLAGVLLASAGRSRHAAPAVLYFGGNAEEVTAYAVDAERRYGRRAVLLMNYRGYGASGGKPGEAALVADAIAHLRLGRPRAPTSTRRASASTGAAWAPASPCSSPPRARALRRPHVALRQPRGRGPHATTRGCP